MCTITYDAKCVYVISASQGSVLPKALGGKITACLQCRHFSLHSTWMPKFSPQQSQAVLMAHRTAAGALVVKPSNYDFRCSQYTNETACTDSISLRDEHCCSAHVPEKLIEEQWCPSTAAAHVTTIYMGSQRYVAGHASAFDSDLKPRAAHQGKAYSFTHNCQCTCREGLHWCCLCHASMQPSSKCNLGSPGRSTIDCMPCATSWT